MQTLKGYGIKGAPRGVDPPVMVPVFYDFKPIAYDEPLLLVGYLVLLVPRAGMISVLAPTCDFTYLRFIGKETISPSHACVRMYHLPNDVLRAINIPERQRAWSLYVWAPKRKDLFTGLATLAVRGEIPGRRLIYCLTCRLVDRIYPLPCHVPIFACKRTQSCRNLTAGVESVTHATSRNPLGRAYIRWQTDIMPFARRNQSRQYTPVAPVV